MWYGDTALHKVTHRGVPALCYYYGYGHVAGRRQWTTRHGGDVAGLQSESRTIPLRLRLCVGFNVWVGVGFRELLTGRGAG